LIFVSETVSGNMLEMVYVTLLPRSVRKYSAFSDQAGANAHSTPPPKTKPVRVLLPLVTRNVALGRVASTLPYATNTINGINSGTVGISGGLFGGTYGYNFQLGSWVLGFEGDFSWSGIRSKFFDNNGSDFCSPAVELECMTNLLWLGTDRGRLGYAWDRLLVYGTAVWRVSAQPPPPAIPR
jgi:hypothetical protein